jgi:tetratricopeptide (TPR) repeat protein
MTYLLKEKLLLRSSFVLAGILVCQFFASSNTVLAQGPPLDPSTAARFADVKIGVGNNKNLLLTIVSDVKSHLDRQAVIKLHDAKRDFTVWQTTDGESIAEFHDLDFGDYDVEISAFGYLPERKVVHVTTTPDPSIQMQIVLQKDPEAVELSAADNTIPANLRKDAARAVYLLKSSNYKDAQKKLVRVYAAVPSSAQINFLMGYLYLQLKDLDKSQTYLTKAASLDPRQCQTLTLLGRLQLQREHYEDARKSLEQAVADDNESWMAHNLLADAYLKQKEYDKAREQAELALEKGKGAGSAAQLVLGQALANVGRDKEALQSLNGFIQTNPANPVIPQVKDLIAQIEKRDANPGGGGTLQAGADLALAASEPSLPPSAWGPPGVDDVKPSVAAGVACPYDQIIEMSGERVKQLVDSIAQFAATEDMLHEQLDPVGNPITKVNRKYDYAASITEQIPGYLQIDEYRNDRYGIPDLPDRIVTSGFVSLALIFHPSMRENYAITCEGLGDWHGQATWLMHFRQRDDKPSRLADLVVGGQSFPINLKGRAWITANTFQIVRIESELSSAIPVLAVQHQIAEYGPVHFQKKNIDLWLPQTVDLFFELNRHRYYRKQTFDHYMLFATNAEEKQQVPKKAPPATQKQNR